MRRQRESGLTYPEVGATAGELPPGYSHVHRASEQLLTWDLQTLRTPPKRTR